jgi:hypothetical protein
MSKRIPITKGHHILVDEIDYEWVGQWKWHCFTTNHSKNQYAIRNNPRTDGRQIGTIKLHRQVLERKIERILSVHEVTDHINGNGLDNRRCNLRVASTKENIRNQRIRSGGSSRFKGVCTYPSARGRWLAQIGIDRKIYKIGKYIEEEEAARAYDWWAIHYFGEFARTNFTDIRPPNPIRLKYYNRLKRMFRTSGSWGVSRFLGVRWNKEIDKWRTDVNGKFIGHFEIQEEAAAAYDRVALQVHGPQTTLNFAQVAAMELRERTVA